MKQKGTLLLLSKVSIVFFFVLMANDSAAMLRRLSRPRVTRLAMSRFKLFARPVRNCSSLRGDTESTMKLAAASFVAGTGGAIVGAVASEFGCKAVDNFFNFDSETKNALPCKRTIGLSSAAVCGSGVAFAAGGPIGLAAFVAPYAMLGLSKEYYENVKRQRWLKNN